MTRWRVDRDWSAERGLDCDTETAFGFGLKAEDGAERLVTVEFVRAGHGSLAAYAAREIVARYLDHAEPSRRLVVDEQGNVSPTEV